MQYAKLQAADQADEKMVCARVSGGACLAVCAAVGTASGTWLPGLSASGAEVLDAVPYFRGFGFCCISVWERRYTPGFSAGTPARKRCSPSTAR